MEIDDQVESLGPDRGGEGEVGAGRSGSVGIREREEGAVDFDLAAPQSVASRLIDLFRERGGDPALRDRLAAAYIDAEAYRWQTFGTVTRIVEGAPTGPESSMVKIFWSELDVALHDLALDLLGPHAELLDGPEGAWMKGYEFSLAGPIYAGTNEIQRNVVAERVLGLPRK